MWVIYAIFCSVGWTWTAIALGFLMTRIVQRGREMIHNAPAGLEVPSDTASPAGPSRPATGAKP
jgi:hypothetical protein